MLSNFIQQRVHSMMGQKEPMGKMYQVFGLDILLDENYKAWLLEINDHPSMDIFLCKNVMGCNHKFCPHSQVDIHVKQKLLTDIFKLMLQPGKKLPAD